MNYIVGLYNLLPAHRRTKLFFRGAWWLVLCKLLKPYFQSPVTIITPSGVKLRITTDRIDEKVLLHLLQDIPHWYFPSEADSISNPTILDLGAHHGYYAMLALGRYSNSKVICVEPSSSAVRIIEKNAQLNRWGERVKIVWAGLSSKSGEGILNITSASWDYHIASNCDNTANAELVPLMTLDEILNGEHVDIVKCNAEGAEYFFVEQLQYMFVKPKLVILMLHNMPSRGSVHGVYPKSCTDFLGFIVKSDHLERTFSGYHSTVLLHQ